MTLNDLQTQLTSEISSGRINTKTAHAVISTIITHTVGIPFFSMYQTQICLEALKPREEKKEEEKKEEIILEKETVEKNKKGKKEEQVDGQ